MIKHTWIVTTFPLQQSITTEEGSGVAWLQTIKTPWDEWGHDVNMIDNPRNDMGNMGR